MPHKDPEENKAYRRRYDLERYHNRRSKAFKFLGGKCKNCGSTERLELDHINPAEKEISLGKLWGIAEKRFFREVGLS